MAVKLEKIQTLSSPDDQKLLFHYFVQKITFVWIKIKQESNQVSVILYENVDALTNAGRVRVLPRTSRRIAEIMSACGRLQHEAFVAVVTAAEKHIYQSFT